MRRAILHPSLRPFQHLEHAHQPIRHRLLSTSTPRLTSWSPGPAPPRLPKDEQEIFEQLQKQSTGAFSTPRRSPPQVNQSPQQTSSSASASTDPLASSAADTQPQQQTRRQPPQINQSPHSQAETLSKTPAPEGAQPLPTQQQLPPRPAVRTGDGEELHPNIRRGAAPEFEGEVNPKTGEAGGPKNEPLRWGHESDWSYNGRVTDF